MPGSIILPKTKTPPPLSSPLKQCENAGGVIPCEESCVTTDSPRWPNPKIPSTALVVLVRFPVWETLQLHHKVSTRGKGLHNATMLDQKWIQTQTPNLDKFVHFNDLAMTHWCVNLFSSNFSLQTEVLVSDIGRCNKRNWSWRLRTKSKFPEYGCVSPQDVVAC